MLLGEYLSCLHVVHVLLSASIVFGGSLAFFVTNSFCVVSSLCSFYASAYVVELIFAVATFNPSLLLILGGVCRMQLGLCVCVQLFS